MNRRNFLGSLFTAVPAIVATAMTAPALLASKPAVPGGKWVPCEEWLENQTVNSGHISTNAHFVRPTEVAVNCPVEFETTFNYDDDVDARVQALKRNYRQTHRINRRCMERVQSVKSGNWRWWHETKVKVTP